MPHELELQIVTFLTNLIQSIGWVGIFFMMLIESANIPLPSEITMPLAGWLLVQAKGGTVFEALLLGGLIGAFGCLVGSVINYWVGAYGGRPFLQRYGKYLLINPHDIDRADQWFKRWGDWASFISRLLPIVRTFISFPAGVARINFPRFAVFTFIGSFIWCAALAAGGFYLGERWEDLRNVMRPFDYPIALILLVAIAYYIYRHVRHARTVNIAETEASQ